MGVLDESENHTPLSLTQGSSVHHQSTPNHAGLADLTAGAPFHEENDTDNELPFLSVLNTVIDHCMMEPSEFETRQKVPVLRVFGPRNRANRRKTLRWGSRWDRVTATAPWNSLSWKHLCKIGVSACLSERQDRDRATFPVESCGKQTKVCWRPFVECTRYRSWRLKGVTWGRASVHIARVVDDTTISLETTVNFLKTCGPNYLVQTSWEKIRAVLVVMHVIRPSCESATLCIVPFLKLQHGHREAIVVNYGFA